MGYPGSLSDRGITVTLSFHVIVGMPYGEIAGASTLIS